MKSVPKYSWYPYSSYPKSRNYSNVHGPFINGILLCDKKGQAIGTCYNIDGPQNSSHCNKATHNSLPTCFSLSETFREMHMETESRVLDAWVWALGDHRRLTGSLEVQESFRTGLS